MSKYRITVTFEMDDDFDEKFQSEVLADATQSVIEAVEYYEPVFNVKARAEDEYCMNKNSNKQLRYLQI